MAEQLGVRDRINETVGSVATAAMFAPVAAIEMGARVSTMGAKILRTLIKPGNRPPDIPWHMPPDQVEQLRQEGLTDKQIGHRQRFSRKSYLDAKS